MHLVKTDQGYETDLTFDGHFKRGNAFRRAFHTLKHQKEKIGLEKDADESNVMKSPTFM